MLVLTDKELSELRSGDIVLVAIPEDMDSTMREYMSPGRYYEAAVNHVTVVPENRPLVSMWLTIGGENFYILNRNCAHLNEVDCENSRDWEVYRGDLS